MLQRQLKQDSHFLYVCDDNLQIRTRLFFKTDSKIDVMGLYEVQWGRSDDVDTALVIASGDYESIHALYQEHEVFDITANKLIWCKFNSIDSKILSGIVDINKITTIAKIAYTTFIAKITTIDPSSPSSLLLLQPAAKRQQRPSASPALPTTAIKTPAGRQTKKDNSKYHTYILHNATHMYILFNWDRE